MEDLYVLLPEAFATRPGSQPQVHIPHYLLDQGLTGGLMDQTPTQEGLWRTCRRLLARLRAPAATA